MSCKAASISTVFCITGLPTLTVQHLLIAGLPISIMLRLGRLPMYHVDCPVSYKPGEPCNLDCHVPCQAVYLPWPACCSVASLSSPEEGITALLLSVLLQALGCPSLAPSHHTTALQGTNLGEYYNCGLGGPSNPLTTKD